MVEVIYATLADHALYNGGKPTIHIHSITRRVYGNEISIEVHGELKIAAKEVVFAKEFKLNTIQCLQLTPETGANIGYIAQKWIYHKGEYGNYASIDVFDCACTEQTAGRGPSDGSIWLDFIALGE